MVKILMSMDGRFAVIEDDIYQVAGAVQCGNFMVMKHICAAEMELITNDEMNEIYDLLQPEDEEEETKNYPCAVEDEDGECHCLYPKEFNSSGEACRKHCGLGVA